MLTALAEPAQEPGERPGYVAFFRLERRDGNRDFDVGLHRHWLDPTVPFALTLAAPAQGVLVTSATLRDAGTGDPELAWSAAEARVGAPHLPSPAIRATVASPFDYAAQTRVLVVTDVAQGDIGQLAAAFQALFVAAAWRRGLGAWPLPRSTVGARRACLRDRAGTGGAANPALRAARRCDGQRHFGRYLSGRGR